jgi:hypothetical protein
MKYLFLSILEQRVKKSIKKTFVNHEDGISFANTIQGSIDTMEKHDVFPGQTKCADDKILGGDHREIAEIRSDGDWSCCSYAYASAAPLPGIGIALLGVWRGKWTGPVRGLPDLYPDERQCAA